MPIPIDLDRYVPQTGQTGAPVNDGHSTALFATGARTAGLMAQAGREMQGAMGDLAGGLRSLSGAAVDLRRQRERELAIADESGAAAFMHTAAQNAELGFSQATSREDVDRLEQQARSDIAAYGDGKSESGEANLRTVDSRKAFNARAAMTGSVIGGMASRRRAELERGENLARSENLYRSANETSIDNLSAGVAAINQQVANDVAAGLVPAGEQAVQRRTVKLSEMAAYRADYLLSKAPEAGDDVSFRAWKAETRKQLDAMSDYAPRGSSAKWEKQLDMVYDAAVARRDRKQAAAESDAISNLTTELFSVDAAGLNPGDVAGLETKLRVLSNDQSVLPETRERAAALGARLRSEVGKATAATVKEVGDTYRLRLSVLDAELAMRPTEAPRIRKEAIDLVGRMTSDERVSLADAKQITDDFKGIISATGVDAKPSPEKKAALEYVNEKASLGLFNPSTYTQPGMLWDSEKQLQGLSKKDRDAALSGMKADVRSRVLAEEDRRKLWALNWTNDWFSRKENWTKGREAFVKDFDAAWGVELQRDIARKAAWQ